MLESTSFVIRRFPTTFSIDKIHDETAEESLVLDGNTEEGKLRSQEWRNEAGFFHGQGEQGATIVMRDKKQGGPKNPVMYI